MLLCILLASMFRWAYGAASPLLVYDDRSLFAQLFSTQGVRQGDPFAAFCFALLVQPLYEAAIRNQPQCHAVSVQDDLTIIGPQDQVFAAFNYIRHHAAEFGLTLRTDKCAVLLPASLDAASREVVTSFCSTLGVPVSDRMESLGVMFGPDAAVEEACRAKVEKHRSFFKALKHPAMPVQVALLLLRHCALPKLSYLARTTHPLQFRAAAGEFDEQVRSCFLDLLEFPLDTRSICPDLRRNIHSLLSQPLSSGGVGLRSVVDTSPAAYFASLAATLPDFIAELRPTPENCEAFDEAGSLPAVHLQHCLDALLAQGVGKVTSEAGASIPAQVSLMDLLAAPPDPALHRGDAAGVAAPILRNVSASSASSSSPSSASSLFSSRAPLVSLWRSARHHAAKIIRARTLPRSTMPPAFLHQMHIQKAATDEREKHERDTLWQTSAPFARAAMTAASAPHASAFLTSLPSQPAYTLDDESMRLSLRHRLGLPASTPLTFRTCVCGTRFLDDSDHFHSCPQTRGAALTQRHDHIVNTLAELAQKHCGFVVTREPNDHLRPAELDAEATRRAEAAARADVQDDLPLHWNRHGDLLLVRHQLRLYVDVSVVRPTAASTLQSLSSVQRTPLVATVARAKAKLSKYAAICAANDDTMVPFVMETYGGLGVEAEAMLRTMAEHAQTMSPRAFIRHARRVLSVCLQRGNAQVALLGQQHLRRQQSVLVERRAFAGYRPAASQFTGQQSSVAMRRRMEHQLQADDAFSWDQQQQRQQAGQQTGGEHALAHAFQHAELTQADVRAERVDLRGVAAAGAEAARVLMAARQAA